MKIDRNRTAIHNSAWMSLITSSAGLQAIVFEIAQQRPRESGDSTIRVNA